MDPRILQDEKHHLENTQNDIREILTRLEREIKALENESDLRFNSDYESISIAQQARTRLRSKRAETEDLERWVDEPYFARIDIANSQEKITGYIGKEQLKNNSGVILTYDWRSPLADLYYLKNQLQYRHENHRFDVKLRRQFEIKKGDLIKYEDIFNSGLTDSDRIEIVDTFLLRILEERRNQTISTNIIRTIQEKQNKIIRMPINANYIVQGVAGSGKTMILFHRLSYLLFNHKEIGQERYCVITPNELFDSQFKELSKNLGLDMIKRMSLESYYADKINAYQIGIERKQITFSAPERKMDYQRYSREYVDELIKFSNQYLNHYYIDDINRQLLNSMVEGLKHLVSYLLLSGKVDNDEFLTLQNQLNEADGLSDEAIKDVINQIDLRKYQGSEAFRTRIREFRRHINYFQRITATDGKSIQATINVLDNLMVTYNQNHREATRLLQLNLKQLNSTVSDSLKQKLKINRIDEVELFDLIGQVNSLSGGISNREVEQAERIEKKSLFVKKEYQEKIGLLKDAAANKRRELLLQYGIEDLEKEAESLQKSIALQRKAEEDIHSRLKKVLFFQVNKRNKINEEKLEIERNRYLLESKFDLASEKIKFILMQNQTELDRIKNQTEVELGEISSVYEVQIKELDEKLKLIKNDQNKMAVETKKFRDELLIIAEDYLSRNPLELDGLSKVSIETKKEELKDNKIVLTIYRDFLLDKNISKTKITNYDVHDLFSILKLAISHLGVYNDDFRHFLIDEAQQINFYEYSLLKDMNPNSTFTLFGDLQQKLNDSDGIRRWEDLKQIFSYKYFELLENYRNSMQITNYVNEKMGLGMNSIGLEGPQVNLRGALVFKPSHNGLTALIYKDAIAMDAVLSRYNQDMFNEIQDDNMVFRTDKINVISLKMCKGLEFTKVYVLTNEMGNNDKYVAYTRALEELIIRSVSFSK